MWLLMMHVVPKGLGLFRELVKSIIRPIPALGSTLERNARRRGALTKQDALFLLRLWQRFVYDINVNRMYYEAIYKDKFKQLT